MDKSIKDAKRAIKKSADEKYVLLCVMSPEDMADARAEADNLAESGTKAYIILIDGKRSYKALYALALTGRCIYCGIFTHEPVPEEIAMKLCCGVRVYAFSAEERRSGEDRRDEERRGQDRRSGKDRRTGDRRSGERRTAERRTDDRRSAGTTQPDADSRSGEDRRGEDRRGSDRRLRDNDRRDNDRRNNDRRNNDRRNNDRRETDRRVITDRRSGNDRRSDSNRRSNDGEKPPRRIYTVFIDSSLPEGYRARCCEKGAEATAVSLAGSAHENSAESADGTRKTSKLSNSRLTAIIIALLLIIIYCLLYRASFAGCINPIY